MKMPKKQPRKQLEKFSTVFMQIGLLLTLFVVYSVLEFQTEKKEDLIEVTGERITDYEMPADQAIEFRRVVPKKATPPPTLEQPKKLDFTKPKVVDNSFDVPESLIPKDEEPQKIDITSLPDEPVEEPIDESEDPLPLIGLQHAPVFRGCEGLSEQEGRKCLERKMKAHVGRYFDAGLAEDLGMSPGKYRIATQFVIDKDGKISEIKIRAPHAALKKEVERVVKKLPKFKPGMQQSKPVKVRYTLPITFRVD